ncbi:MAG: TonB-dependent receptor [Myxococcales bacterium]
MAWGAEPSDAKPEDAPAQGDDLLQTIEDIGEMSLSDVLASKTSVASSAATQTLREAPGLVTVITRDEIVGTGARDLLDILHRVPGLQFAQDTEGLVGLSVRGNWAFEGKALLLVDGHEMNETLFQTSSYGDHFPADLIERVEVMRGPGSAVYGGFAELAVINVVTRTAESLKGPAGSARLSSLPDSGSIGRGLLSLSWGDVFQVGGKPLKVALSGAFGESKQSGRLQQDSLGQTFSMSSNSARRPALLALNASWGDLALSFLYDDYQVTDRTGYDEALPYPVVVGNQGFHALLCYDLKLPLGFSVLPKLRFKQQTPWHNVAQDEGINSLLYYDVTAQRFEASLGVSWRYLSWLDAQVGGAFTYDRASMDAGYEGTFVNDRRDISFDNVAVYAEATARTVVDVTAGARYEHHSLYGDSFVPRGAVTGVFKDFHAKLLAAQAFKAPGIENINTNLAIVPERTTSFELELGYLLLPELFLSVSGFYLSIDKPIVYEVDATTGYEGYVNGDSAGSCGVEAEVRYRSKAVSARVSYSYYTAACAKQPEQYRADDRKSVLGQANHKLSIQSSLEVWKGVRLAPALLLFSGRAYVEADAEGAPVLRAAQPAVLIDLWASYKPPFFKGFSLSVGVNNLLDNRLDLIQPYQGGKPPMRAFDREVGLRIGYDTP